MNILQLILDGVAKVRDGKLWAAIADFATAIAQIATEMQPATKAPLQHAVDLQSCSREELCGRIEACCADSGAVPWGVLLSLLNALLTSLLHG